MAESELTDERVRGIVDGAKRGAVFAGLDSYDLVATLGEALLAVRARIAELERDLADARAKLGQAERDNELLSGNMNTLTDAWQEGLAAGIGYMARGRCALPENPYAPAGEEAKP
jgi:hypothetical protein